MAAVEWQYLPWLFRWIVNIVEETGVDAGTFAPVVFPEDSDEQVQILFSVSLNEFTAILSALEKGAPLSYPDSDQAVIWSFLRNYEYPVDLCAQIANAILTCTDVQNALAEAISENEGIGDAISEMLQSRDDFNDFITSKVQGLTTGQITGPLLKGECDNSVVCGQIVAIVERLHQNNVDFLEIVEVGTNDEERVSALLSAIPGLSESPVDELLDVLQSLLENFAENYNAAVTEGWKDEVEEDLYCLALQDEDCQLTYQQIFDYFNGRAGSNLTIASIIKNVVQFVINGDFSTDDLIASGLFAIQLAFVLAGRDFYGIDIGRLGSIARDADESTKWEDFDECPTGWCRSFVGPDLQSVFTPTGGLGAQATWNGTGYTANSGLINSRITLEADLGSSVVVEDIVCIYDTTPTPGAINSVTMYAEHFASVLGSAAWVLETLIDITGTTMQKFDVDTVSSFDTSVPITATLVEIRVRGSGTPPDVGVAC